MIGHIPRIRELSEHPETAELYVKAAQVLNAQALQPAVSCEIVGPTPPKPASIEQPRPRKPETVQLRIGLLATGKNAIGTTYSDLVDAVCDLEAQKHELQSAATNSNQACDPSCADYRPVAVA